MQRVWKAPGRPARCGFSGLVDWVGLGWVGLGWVGLGWVGLGWVEVEVEVEIGLGWLRGNVSFGEDL